MQWLTIKKKKLYKLCILSAVALLTFQHAETTLAIAFIDDPSFRAQNDVLYTETCKTTSSGESTDDFTPLEGSDNAQKVWNYFKSKGLSDEQVAGIMGNLAWESGDPTFNNATDSEELSGGGGYGLAQWTGGRRTQINEAATRAGTSVTDLQFQLDYLHQEMTTRTERDGGSTTEFDGIKGTSSAAEAAEYFMYNFERPGDLRLKERVDLANGYLQKYGGTGGGAGESSDTLTSSNTECDDSEGSPGVTDADCGEGGFIGTLKCYAWPNYRGNDITPTEDYQKAIDNALSQDRYVGGTAHKGIDCGGFVSLLLQDSGFEPAYNYSGKGGNTVSQYQWTADNWQTLGKGNEINVADLLPGDVANDKNNHTFIFVGQVEGFEPTGIASASWDERAPMAGRENPTQSKWTWFRKK